MKWLSSIVLCVAWVAMTGCGPSESEPSCPDPAEGEVDEACGLWVSASLGDDGNPGTRAAPMASLTAAVAAAAETHRDVYACGELWTEPLVLPADVSLFGGFDCEHGWAYDGEGHRARLETGPDLVPLETSGYAGHMVVADVDIKAGDATVPGGSSIGVLVTDIQDITFRRCKIIAGNAADGLDGEVLDELLPPGTPGSAGAPACTTQDGPGGAAVESVCAQDQVSTGGEGGDGGAMSTTGGEAGSPVPSGDKVPSNPQDGDGGKGQVGVESCTPGEPGAPGADGEPGVAPHTVGLLTAEGYFGADGTDGKEGLPGQGGGGGGGSLGGAAACGALPPGGAGGGSGGGGGCGGKGGRGGQAGGSSFAIVMIKSGELFLDGCELWVGNAGRGGDGAPGQPGAEGGDAGQGGIGKGAAQSGCNGGKGGAGGRGGGGAGGHGGHAVHLAYSDSASAVAHFPGTTYHGNDEGGFAGRGGGPGANDGYPGWGNKQEYDFVVLAFADVQ